MTAYVPNHMTVPGSQKQLHIWNPTPICLFSGCS